MKKMMILTAAGALLCTFMTGCTVNVSDDTLSTAAEAAVSALDNADIKVNGQQVDISHQRRTLVPKRLAFRGGVGPDEILVVIAAHRQMRPVGKPVQHLPRMKADVDEIAGEDRQVDVRLGLLHGPERIDIRVNVRDHEQFQGQVPFLTKA